MYLHAPIVRTKHIVRLSGYPLIEDSLSRLEIVLDLELALDPELAREGELDLGHHLVVHHHLQIDLALDLVHLVEGLAYNLLSICQLALMGFATFFDIDTVAKPMSASSRMESRL